MLESRWRRQLGTGIAATAAILAIASTTLGAPAAELAAPPICGGDTAPSASPRSAAWYRLDPVIDDGVRTGQRLQVGRIGGPAWTVDLDPESFATGPFHGLVVTGTDDGRRSTVSMADLGRGCTTVVGTSRDVIRRAVLAPDGASIFEFRVDRRDRRDLGVWRRSPGSDDAQQVLEPIPADPAFGITWTTDLAWSADGRALAVTSCGEAACRIRVLDPATGGVQTVADPTLGGFVGLADERVVVRGACPGLPCPIVAVDLGDGSTHVLADAAGLAALVVGEDGRRNVIAYEADASGGLLRTVTLDGVASQTFAAPDGLRPLGTHDGSGADLPAGWLLLGPDGRLPATPGTDVRAHHLADGQTLRLDEVLP
ncbi:MAG: hypothetical protein ABIP77_06335 [Candidatus Limnocylindrales bacterium]